MTIKIITTLPQFIEEYGNCLLNFTGDNKFKPNTIVLNQYLSYSFGQALDSDNAYLLVPEHFYNMFKNGNNLRATYIPNKSGLYVHFTINKGTEDEKELRLRIFIRAKRIKALSFFSRLHIAEYDSNNDRFTKEKSFHIPLEAKTN